MSMVVPSYGNKPDELVPMPSQTSGTSDQLPMNATTATDQATRGANAETQLKQAYVYRAAAAGNIEFLKACGSERLQQFLTVTGDTILHVNIAANSNTYCKYRYCRNIERFMPFMLEQCPSLLHKPNKKGETAMHLAARYGMVSIAQNLIAHFKSEHDADPESGATGDPMSGAQAVREMIRRTSLNGETSLHEAVRYGRSKIVDLLITEEDPKFQYLANKDGETPLYLAAERGNRKLVRRILSGFESPAYGGPNGRTALHAGVIHGYVGIARDILKKEGLHFLAKEVDEQGWTPLHFAAYLSHIDMVEMLLSYDQSAAYVAAKDGKTALHFAAKDESESDHNHPLSAASKGTRLMVSKFIYYSPDCFKLVDERGQNALHVALERGNRDVVNLILGHEELGDLVNTKDNNGNTPLHIYAASGKFFKPKLMTDPRFDRMAFNNENLNPLDVALASAVLADSLAEIHISKIKKRALQDAQFKPGLRKLDKNDEEEKAKTNDDKGEGHTSNEKDNDRDQMEARQNYLVVAALIATVTFAAGFTLPGGYIQENGPDMGYAVLTENTAFKAFVISDTLAMLFSTAAVFIHLLIGLKKGKMMMPYLFDKALRLTLYAILAMVVAFITGTYAVLAHSRLLAITACVIGCLFFLVYWYLLEKVFVKFIYMLLWPFHYVLQKFGPICFYIVRQYRACGLVRSDSDHHTSAESDTDSEW